MAWFFQPLLPAAQQSSRISGANATESCTSGHSDSVWISTYGVTAAESVTSGHSDTVSFSAHGVSVEESCTSGYSDGTSFSASVAVLQGEGGIGDYGAGFTSGGYNQSVTLSSVSKIAFNSESNSNIAATLTDIRSDHTGIGSTNHGYFAGGNSWITTVDKMTYATEGIAANSASLPVAATRSAGVVSTVAGYTLGGDASVGNEIQGITFSTDASRNPSAALGLSRQRAQGVSSSTIGYALGGYVAGNDVGNVDGIRFSDEAAVNGANALPAARGYGAAATQSDTNGYICAGGSPATKTAVKISFSTETTANVAATAALTRTLHGCLTSALRGYMVNGYVGSFRNTIEKLIFSTETFSATGNITDVNRQQVGTLSFSRPSTVTSTSTTQKFESGTPVGTSELTTPNTGFYLGGSQSTSPLNTIDALRFVTETVNTSVATLGTARDSRVAIKSQVRGYLFNTYGNSAVDGLLFSTEATATLSTSLAITGLGTAAPVAGNNIGYVFGGYDGSLPITTIEGFVYSNETKKSVSATISTGIIERAASVESLTNGYIGGGDNGTTQVDRIGKFTLSSETYSALGAVLATARRNAGGVSSSTVGYFIGGAAGTATTEVDGVVFSSDTATNPAAALAVATPDATGTNSSDSGYVMPDSSGGPINKFAFSTETFGITIYGSSEAHGSGISNSSSPAKDASGATPIYGSDALGSTTASTNQSSIYTTSSSGAEAATAAEVSGGSAVYVVALAEVQTATGSGVSQAVFPVASANSASSAAISDGAFSSIAVTSTETASPASTSAFTTTSSVSDNPVAAASTSASVASAYGVTSSNAASGSSNAGATLSALVGIAENAVSGSNPDFISVVYGDALSAVTATGASAAGFTYAAASSGSAVSIAAVSAPIVWWVQERAGARDVKYGSMVMPTVGSSAQANAQDVKTAGAVSVQSTQEVTSAIEGAAATKTAVATATASTSASADATTLQIVVSFIGENAVASAGQYGGFNKYSDAIAAAHAIAASVATEVFGADPLDPLHSFSLSVIGRHFSFVRVDRTMAVVSTNRGASTVRPARSSATDKSERSFAVALNKRSTND